MDIKQIIAVVVLMITAPIAIAVGTVTVFETTGSIDTTSGRIYFTDNTGAADFNENGVWENYVDNQDLGAGIGDNVPVITISTAGITGENLTVTINENEAGVENAVIHQTVTISTSEIEAGVDTATIAFKYCVIDNDNASTLNIIAVLDTGVENVTIYSENKALENSTTFTSVENNVKTWIRAAGTFQLFLRVEAEPQVAVDTSDGAVNIIVHFDDASLTIKTFARDDLENTVIQVEQQTATGYNLASFLPLIIAAVSLIGVIVVGFYGLYATTQTRR